MRRGSDKYILSQQSREIQIEVEVEGERERQRQRQRHTEREREAERKMISEVLPRIYRLRR